MSHWSKPVQFFAFVAELIITWLICFWVFQLADTPHYKSYSLTPHQNVHWGGGYNELKVQAGSSLVVRSEGENFTITDQDGRFVCTGTPVQMTPSDQSQPFECEITADTDQTLHLSGYATIYTTSKANIELEQPVSIGMVTLSAIAGSIFGVSVLLFIFWLLELLK